ncbi:MULTISPECIES: phosphohydrolase [Sphaerochaeta]|jgi:metal-dependent HD superfamily phosphatase/phosphodiesterase|uniref:Phosphohydrolase n=1 Tax=Sphaerochaeta associata TaxID=1129264 RepID=A0ABY4D705_9SPIR|nr:MULTISPECIES: phosphohydrolase [Sphaerochaeta]MDT3360317.1 phosphohydrolase [Spirochaetota bacterium]MDD2394866.1 phosphohydrolase [Sphaerochaeta sp.]MDD3425074.1 phosphohydrolase [Sphaerochaeta sp.]MDD3457342.1 phosphohydrolase [Sphaerochaeta sp.]MDD4038928.1 phosphohydrolase [Sphaerochaeta sp.]
MKSPKEHHLERHLLSLLTEGSDSHALAKLLISDPEIEAIQDYANSVSIKRLNYNDHGPVHMRQVAVNVVKMLSLLKQDGVKTSLEIEEAGSHEDSLCALLLAAFLHDLGMSVGRSEHELTGLVIARPIMDRLLQVVLPSSLSRRIAIMSIATEGVLGHMANRKIHSLEAGLLLVADGCDMEKGRARIPMSINTSPKTGDIHKYSANSIEKVTISKGEGPPILIDVQMSSDVGFFQIEEVLLPKISMSPAKQYVQIFAGVIGQEKKRYL